EGRGRSGARSRGRGIFRARFACSRNRNSALPRSLSTRERECGIPPTPVPRRFSLPSLTGSLHCVPRLHAPKSCRFLIPQEGTMNSFLQRGAMVALGMVIAACSSGPGTKDDATYSVPVEYHTLDNGLKVVLSEDRSAPTAVVAVYYNIGFRIEPEERTGFAHLFEHMMFQGSENLGKMEFVRLIQRNGGVLNGS